MPKLRSKSNQKRNKKRYQAYLTQNKNRKEAEKNSRLAIEEIKLQNLRTLKPLDVKGIVLKIIIV